MTCLHSLYGFQPVIFAHTEMISASGVPPSCTSALRVPTRRDKKSTPSHALNGFPPGNFLLHGFGTRAKIQAAFSHSNLLLRNSSGTAMRQWAPTSFFGMTPGADTERRQVPPAPGLGPSAGPVDGRDGSAPMGRRRLKEGDCPASQPFECQPPIPPRIILVCSLLLHPRA